MDRSWAWMDGVDERNVVGDGEIRWFGDGEWEMAMLTSASDGGNRHGVGIEFLVKDLQRSMVRFVAIVGLKSGKLGMRKLMGDQLGHDCYIFNSMGRGG